MFFAVFSHASRTLRVATQVGLVTFLSVTKFKKNVSEALLTSSPAIHPGFRPRRTKKSNVRGAGSKIDIFWPNMGAKFQIK